MRRFVRSPLFRWGLYWLAVLGGYFALSFAFGNFLLYLPFPLLAGVQMAVRVLPRPLLRKIPRPRVRFFALHGVNLCAIAVAVLLFGVLVEEGTDVNNAYIASMPAAGYQSRSAVSYDADTGVYTLRATGEDFRILQLTDIHLSSSLTSVPCDRKALDACDALIRETEPDLVIVTGDLAYPLLFYSFPRDNLVPFGQFGMLMDRLGIPWAMVYGNHDTESVALYDAQHLSGLFRYFRDEGAGVMLYADRQPSIYGRYNQYLRIENPDGSLNRILFLLDSNDYLKGRRAVDAYDSIHPDQMDWYAETIDALSAAEGRTVPSFVFQHIPFRAFADAEAALAAGDPSAVYICGENGETVSCPDVDFGFFDLILEKGSTDAVFVGHDHYNNLAVHYKGVDLVYSRSIDYIAYPGIAGQNAQRGGTLITLTPDGGYTLASVPYVPAE